MQRPTVETGAILKRQYWQPWVSADPPNCELTVMSLDTAASTEDEAANSAMTLWGLWRGDDGKGKMIMLGGRKGRWDYVDLKANALEWYKNHNPDVVLIENKSTGQSLIPELILMGLPIVKYSPDKDKDKVARAHSCTPTLAQGKVFVPFEKLWAKIFMQQAAEFPKGRENDYIDTFTQALIWLRRNGYFELKEDIKDEEEYEDLKYRRKRKAPY